MFLMIDCEFVFAGRKEFVEDLSAIVCLSLLILSIFN